MTEQEWLDRYKRRFMERAALSDGEAQHLVDEAVADFAEASEMFEDDPEGAADEEMSYWSD